MLSVYRTLSVRYLGRRWFRAILIVASIALGVATMVATRALNETMTKAGLATVNPLAGVADLVISNGDAPVQVEVADQIRNVPGVKAANPRIFKNVKLPDYDDRQVLVMGLDVMKEFKEDKTPALDITISEETIAQYVTAYVAAKGFLEFEKRWGPPPGIKLYLPAVVGQELDALFPKGVKNIKVEKDKKAHELLRVGSLEASGPAAVLGGNVLILDLSHAARVLGLKEGQASRIDVVLTPGSKLDEVRQAVKNAIRGRGEVRTPEEQDRAMGNVMSGMQTGFSLCGLAALVVGLFLVYNALAVCVAERRHEIGVLLSLGASRRQIQFLFGGEAVLLGLAGSLLGIPLGFGLAVLMLQPVQGVLRDVFFNIDARHVEISLELMALAVVTGTTTALAAALVPAVEASRENPAEAVRRATKPTSWRRRLLQLAASATLLLGGIVFMMLRKELPYRLGIYGGLVLVLLAALVVTPLITALGARLLTPVSRRVFPLEWRLAADNLLRAPGRTGLVVAAVAAGVALVVQTAGTIRSNRNALRDWVQEYISSDLIVTSGSPVGAAGQTQIMDEKLGQAMERTVAGVEAVLPLRFCKVFYGDTQVFLNAVDAARVHEVDQTRRARAFDVQLYKQLSQQKNTVIVSENFTALYGKDKGDTVNVTSPKAGEVTFTIIGKVVDYSWNHGSLIINRADYLAHWGDHDVDVYDVFVRPGANIAEVQTNLAKKFGAQNSLFVLTRDELQQRIDDMIERLYGICYALLLVVMIVAALGVVMALLISVLQRRREMGLLRAIGASRAQVVRSVLTEAVLMGIFGTIIGVLVGIPLQWYVLKVLILEESGYLFPLYIPWLGALIIALAAIATATLAGLGPALYAVRQRIPEAIAYE